MRENQKWFKEAKFGLMVHFGLYSLLGGEYRGKRMGSFIGEWIQPYFRIPNAEYEKLAGAFDPLYFDADEWVSVAEDCGAKYLVVTSKHHEGFALFDSRADDFTSVKASPFKRDLIEELANACARKNFKLGLYYSQALDWHEKNGGGYETDCGDNLGLPWCNDWDFPNAAEKNYTECFERKMYPQVEELVKNYGDLALIWFDTPMSISKAQSVALYDLVKKYQPDCLINSRLGNIEDGTDKYKFDYRSWGDNEIPEEYMKEGLFETPATLNDTWGYKSYDQNWKSAEEVKRIKEHLNSRGINYLLNVGPDALGRFPAAATDILKKLK